MNLHQAQRRYGMKLTLIDFECQGGKRQAVIYVPGNPRILTNDKMIMLLGHDSTSFLDPWGRLGLLYPNKVPEEICEVFGCMLVCLLPLGWGPFEIVQGFHIHGTPLEKKGLPDDTIALRELMNVLHKFYGDSEYGMLGFADGDAFNIAAASRDPLRDHIRFVIGVNGTTWQSTEEFPLALPPMGQSLLSIHGRANTQIREDGLRSDTLLGRVGETLVAKLPPKMGPRLKLNHYVEANQGLPGGFDLDTNERNPPRINFTTHRGRTKEGRSVIAREILDLDMPHEWSGRPFDTKDGGIASESWLSRRNRRDRHGKTRAGSFAVNEAIVAFLELLYREEF
jgi:hypothetical protein